MRAVHQRILAALVLILIISTLGVLAQQYSSIAWFVERENDLRTEVSEHPIQTWLAGTTVYFCLSLIPGLGGKAILCGWLFGFWPALIMVDLGLTGAAMVTFVGSRFLFREAVESRFGLHLSRFREKLRDSAGFYLLMLRLIHAPFSLVNYASGATNLVSPKTFWWSTQLGILPGTVIFVFLGTQIPDLATFSEQGPLALLDRTLVAALVITALLPIIIRWAASPILNRPASRRRTAGSTDSGNAGAVDV